MPDVTIHISPNAERLLEMLTASGYETYLVGGCVRDALMGRVPHDIDITTQATPDEVKTATSGEYELIGDINYGTSRLRRYGSDEIIEVTTMRFESNYSDGRRPDEIGFTTDINKDLARRDFTMNAIAYDPIRDLIIDPYHGVDDIQNKLIKCVGEPKIRFTEDGLRIMRMLRFAATFDFAIDVDTFTAANNAVHMIKNVSNERIGTELMKMLDAKSSRALFNVLNIGRNIMAEAIPELKCTLEFKQKTPYHDLDLYDHTLYTMKASDRKPIVRLALLFHDIAKPACETIDDNGIAHYPNHPEASAEVAHAVMTRLAIPKEVKQVVEFCIANHERRPVTTKKSAKKFFNKCSCNEELATTLLMVMYCDISGRKNLDLVPEKPGDMTTILLLIKSLSEDDTSCSKVSDLEINGHDVMALGYQGKQIGIILNTLFNLVEDEQIQNNRKKLLQYIAEHDLIGQNND